MAYKDKFTTVSSVVPGSIADELGVVPGDVLIAINDKPIMDVFEYRILEKEEYLTLTFKLHDGPTQTVEVEKDEDELLGMEFEEPMMCNCNSCHNHCIFCFIDQNPKGLRPSLYFKDDDMRMSFLTGNYVTLTNLSDDELDRLLSYHLSPMNISVHATNPEVRRMMLRNKNAGLLMERLRRIVSEGIKINCQCVLCPGINDGAVLEETLSDLSTLGDNVLSIACVPVGITKFREENKLYPVERYNKETAGNVLDIVNKWQNIFLKERGTRLFYAADEFYIRADRPIPPVQEYEGYPQLENGVGLISDYVATMDNLLKEDEKVLVNYIADAPTPIVWDIVGTDAYKFHQSFEDRMNKRFHMDFEAVSILNDFWGHTITVSGLLVGGDIVKQLKAKMDRENRRPDLVMLSSCMLKADEDIFLDDMTLDELKAQLGVKVLVGENTEDAYNKVKEFVTNPDNV